MSVEPATVIPEGESIEISIVDWGNDIGQANQEFVVIETKEIPNESGLTSEILVP